MPSLHDPALIKAFESDKEILKTTHIPVVTVTGTFQEDLKAWHDLPNQNTTPDVVYSRAHFSMPYGFLQTVWKDKKNPQQAWFVDPTNYVQSKKLRSIRMTEDIGQLLARVSPLKKVKDLIDTFGRNKLPILDSITPPLLYLFEEVDHPILSFHIAAGNILAGMGKSVVQVITDPHVREEYLHFSQLPTMRYCVFDEETKIEALEKAELMDKTLDPDRVIVTGPPVDPRIIMARDGKLPPQTRPTRILMTTGGLGTNKAEIRQILEQLLPILRKTHPEFQLMVYCGTQSDIFQMITQLAQESKVRITQPTRDASPTAKPAHQKSPTSSLTILYHPQLFDANVLLIQHGFPWADMVISKPSGDMAYDAVAAGCALLTFKSWGVWEDVIEQKFIHRGLAREAHTAEILTQLQVLTHQNHGKSWLSYAMENAQSIEKIWLQGNRNIEKAVRSY